MRMSSGCPYTSIFRFEWGPRSLPGAVLLFQRGNQTPCPCIALGPLNRKKTKSLGLSSQDICGFAQREPGYQFYPSLVSVYNQELQTVYGSQTDIAALHTQIQWSVPDRAENPSHLARCQSPNPFRSHRRHSFRARISPDSPASSANRKSPRPCSHRQISCSASAVCYPAHHSHCLATSTAEDCDGLAAVMSSTRSWPPRSVCEEATMAVLHHPSQTPERTPSPAHPVRQSRKRNQSSDSWPAPFSRSKWWERKSG
jgi:hypothetical protein